MKHQEGNATVQEANTTVADRAAAHATAAPEAAVAPLKFIPWFRAGAAVLIRGSAAANAQSAPHFRTQVDLAVDGSTVSVPVHLFGPADAAGI